MFKRSVCTPLAMNAHVYHLFSILDVEDSFYSFKCIGKYWNVVI